MAASQQPENARTCVCNWFYLKINLFINIICIPSFEGNVLVARLKCGYFECIFCRPISEREVPLAIIKYAYNILQGLELLTILGKPIRKLLVWLCPKRLNNNLLVLCRSYSCCTGKHSNIIV